MDETNKTGITKTADNITQNPQTFCPNCVPRCPYCGRPLYPCQPYGPWDYWPQPYYPYKWYC
jgi:hypothetical protein